MTSDFLNTVAPRVEVKPLSSAVQGSSAAASDAGQGIDDALANTQGYIMVGHGRDHVWHALIRFRAGTDPETLRQKFQQVTKDGTAPTRTIDLVDEEKRHRADLVVAAIGFTWRGYQQMGFVDCKDRFSLEFQQGFAMRSQDITGRGSEDWNVDQWDPRNGYHALLILAAGREKDGKPVGETLLQERKEKISDVLRDVADITWLKGKILRKQTGNGNQAMLAQKPIEHFGFTDGVSQPELLTWGKMKEVAEPLRNSGWVRGAAPSLVLIREPICGEKDRLEFGSYMAFLNIEQHVDSFNQAAQGLAEKLGIDAVEAKELIIGRKQNGEPLACAAGADVNDFANSTDETGAKWPFACHTRKMNSRQPGQEHHRIVRRGVTYTDGKLKGTYFQCFQADLQEQFEFLFKRWANFRSQPQKGCGVDPLVGLDSNHPQQWPKPTSSNGAVPESTGFTIGELTTIRGGEYFYFPSIPFVRAIEERWGRRNKEPLAS